MFKIGDMVECIDNSYYEDYLDVGKVYEILDERGIGLIVVSIGTNRVAFSHRFKLAVPNNPLSKVLYPNYKPTKCGLYLTKE